MVKITVAIEGMACGMCEAHINEAVSLTRKRDCSLHSEDDFPIR